METIESLGSAQYHKAPSIPAYIRKANSEKIRRQAEATGKSIGAIINELVQQMD